MFCVKEKKCMVDISRCYSNARPTEVCLIENALRFFLAFFCIFFLIFLFIKKTVQSLVYKESKAVNRERKY
jgi:hypothetical protein